MSILFYLNRPLLSVFFITQCFFGNIISLDETVEFDENPPSPFLSEVGEYDFNSLRYNPQVLMDTNGNHFAIWLVTNGTTTSLEGSLKLANGNWKIPVLLTTQGFNVYKQKMVMNQEGNVLIIWLERNNNSSISRVCCYRLNKNGFIGLFFISTPDQYVLEDFVPNINDSGIMSLVWSAYVGQQRSLFYSSSNFNNGIWTPPIKIIN